MDLQTNNIQENVSVKVVLDEYDKRSARYHVKHIQDVLSDDSLLQYLIQSKKEKEDFPFQVVDLEQELELHDVIKGELITKLLSQKNENVAKDRNVTITYSGNNPPLPMKGELFYIVIKTQEGNDLQVISTPQGWVHSGNCYHCLLDLLQDFSPKFKQEYNNIIKQQSGGNQPMQLLSQLKYNNAKWFVTNPPSQGWDWQRTENWLLDLHGLDITSLRDWNEELQVFKQLPKTDFIQKINREKALVKVHSDFLEAAVKGAQAVVDKIIQPLNPMDNELQQVYVYNQIFFSFAMETPDNFRQESGPDATPTVSTTNCDFRNLRLLHKMEIAGLNQLNTALIDYKGRRVIAQSIIPGILNSDHSNCTQYGSIDEGKTIQKQLEFHQLMQKVCEQFHLDDNITFKDKDEKEFQMCGSIEVKGILGSDKRMYLLDLLRLSPRDLNYMDDELDQCCVLRHELIQNYWIEQLLQKSKNSGNMNILQQSQQRLKLNPTLFTKIKCYDSEEKQKEQEEELRKLSSYLLNNAIPQLINDLQVDAQRISDKFHQYGVNMRYLGQVYKRVENVQIKLALERQILCKSAKHIFRQAMRETSHSQLGQVLQHLLNCIFDLSNQQQQQQQQSSKKQKKKKKQQQQQQQDQAQQDQQQVNKSLIELQSSQFLSMNQSQIWDQIKNIALKRYQHDLSDKSLQYPFHKLSCLRELCQQVGLQITAQYQIVNINPIVKCIDIQSDEAKFNQEMGTKLIKEQRYQEAMDCFLTASQIIMNLYGTAHPELANCFSKISALYYQKQEYDTCIQFQKQALTMYITIYGLDHQLTAQTLNSLSLQYFNLKQYSKSFNYMLHALYLQSIIGGENPEIFNTFTNLSLLYSDHSQHQQSINCLFEALERQERIQTQPNLKISAYYQAIALEHSSLGDVQKAVEYQDKALSIITTLLPSEDIRVQDARTVLENFKITLEEKKKSNHNEQKKDKRQFGTNRSQVQQSQVEETKMETNATTDKVCQQFFLNNPTQEREILLMKMRQAKQGLKNGQRRNQQATDVTRWLQAIQMQNLKDQQQQ